MQKSCAVLAVLCFLTAPVYADSDIQFGQEEDKDEDTKSIPKKLPPLAPHATCSGNVISIEYGRSNMMLPYQIMNTEGDVMMEGVSLLENGRGIIEMFGLEENETYYLKLTVGSFRWSGCFVY